MVSTRNHPKTFPAPDLSPTKSTSASSSSTSPTKASRPSKRSESPNTDTNESTALARPSARRSTNAWTHTATPLTFVWLAISLPLVLWDTGFVLGRPHTFPGGKWHAPFSPYAIYVHIDDLYAPAAWERKDGFTSAQGTLNLIETSVYLAYLKVVGREAGIATLVGFAGFIMTLSKTVLYVFVTHFGEWVSLRQHDWWTIFSLWIFPNGLWIALPAYLTYSFGSQILQGLEQAAGLPQKKNK
ncbi:hypothetical protein BT63DRAFT_402299 [Microthyrium microscopicum]|uniref:Emopamil-binding protein n=1 Tax=Microthyrium microscopicum TaxID=703497 RepID=A0A6A6U9Y9_9PEZI|nr:hypothetical protein BT63DRAFT_402299 [Microthyrium microscopicum]